MPIKKIDRLRGLDLRSNPLHQPADMATIAENVHLTADGTLVKRYGFDVHSTLPNCLHLIDYYNETIKGYELLAVVPTGLRRYNENTSSWDIIPSLFTRSINIANKLNTTVHRGVLYLTNGLFDDTIPDFGVITLGDALPLMKYDGTHFYQAGVPKPTFNSSPSGSGAFAIHIYEFKDAQGNIIQSDIAKQTLNSGSNQSYSIGAYDEYKLLRLSADKTYLPTSVVTQSLTLRVYVSTNPNFAFKLVKSINVTNLQAATSVSYTASEISTALDSGDDLSDIYDATFVKRMPPICRQLSSYGELLTLGNIFPVTDAGFDGIANVSGKEVQSTRWSDLSTGGSPESFPALNAATLGSSGSGINGLFGDSDSLIAFKDRNVFNVSGNLFNGNYRSRDTLADDIGGIAPNAIYKVDGGCIFLTERGFYWTTDGLQPKEFSDRIEPLFTKDSTGLDFTKCETASDYENERLLFFIPATDPENSLVVVYDYYHKEWFTYKGFDASGGFEIHNRELYHSDGTTIYKRNTEYNDNGEAIHAKYATAWQTEQYPSLDKKYTDFHILSTESEDYAITVTPQFDWKESEDDTPYETTVYGSDVDTGIPLEAVNAKSLRLIVENSNVGEPLTINSVRYIIQKSQEEPKGDR